MTDKNGKPLKVGDKVTHDALPKKVGTVTATRRTTVDVRFPGTKEKPCHYTSLTLVEPKPNPVFAPMSPGMKQMLEYEERQEEEHYRVSDFDNGIAKAKPNPFSVGLLGHIPVVTSEAVPKDEAWLMDTAKIKEFLGTDEGKEILGKITKPDPVVTTLFGGKVESQKFEFPLPEPDYKGMYEDSRELVRKLTRAAVAVLTAPDGIEKAGAYARLRDAVKEAL